MSPLNVVNLKRRTNNLLIFRKPTSIEFPLKPIMETSRKTFGIAMGLHAGIFERATEQ